MTRNSTSNPKENTAPSNDQSNNSAIRSSMDNSPSNSQTEAQASVTPNNSSEENALPTETQYPHIPVEATFPFDMRTPISSLKCENLSSKNTEKLLTKIYIDNFVDGSRKISLSTGLLFNRVNKTNYYKNVVNLTYNMSAYEAAFNQQDPNEIFATNSIIPLTEEQRSSLNAPEGYDFKVYTRGILAGSGITKYEISPSLYNTVKRSDISSNQPDFTCEYESSKDRTPLPQFAPQSNPANFLGAYADNLSFDVMEIFRDHGLDGTDSSDWHEDGCLNFAMSEFQSTESGIAFLVGLMEREHSLFLTHCGVTSGMSIHYKVRTYKA